MTAKASREVWVTVSSGGSVSAWSTRENAELEARHCQGEVVRYIAAPELEKLAEDLEHDGAVFERSPLIRQQGAGSAMRDIGRMLCALLAGKE